MTKINDTTTFPITSPAQADFVIGTDVSNTTNSAGGETVSFKIGSIGLASDLQSWQNVKSSRSVGTSYQNTTSAPIYVNINYISSSNTGAQISSDNSTWLELANVGNARHIIVSFAVPIGYYYRVISGATIYEWSELR